MVSLYKDPDGDEIFQPSITNAISTVNGPRNTPIDALNHTFSAKVIIIHFAIYMKLHLSYVLLNLYFARETMLAAAPAIEDDTKPFCP